MNDIITPSTHPEHHTVGRHFGGYLSEKKCTVIYFCDSYDPKIGYWLTQVEDTTNRINVSERAIGRTFYEAYDRGDHWDVSQWNVQVPKIQQQPPEAS